jgi:hypothetical protein
MMGLDRLSAHPDPEHMDGPALVAGSIFSNNHAAAIIFTIIKVTSWALNST